MLRNAAEYPFLRNGSAEGGLVGGNERLSGWKKRAI
jgi:hypothetical protein